MVPPCSLHLFLKQLSNACAITNPQFSPQLVIFLIHLHRTILRHSLLSSICFLHRMWSVLSLPLFPDAAIKPHTQLPLPTIRFCFICRSRHAVQRHPASLIPFLQRLMHYPTSTHSRRDHNLRHRSLFVRCLW